MLSEVIATQRTSAASRCKNSGAPAVSRHLRVLEHAGLVRRARDGRLSRCALEAQPMRDAAEWVKGYRRFWEAQLETVGQETRLILTHERFPGAEAASEHEQGWGSCLNRLEEILR